MNKTNWLFSRIQKNHSSMAVNRIKVLLAHEEKYLLRDICLDQQFSELHVEFYAISSKVQLYFASTK